jgi:transcription elongation factor Elf1
MTYIYYCPCCNNKVAVEVKSSEKPPVIKCVNCGVPRKRTLTWGSIPMVMK